VPVTTATNLRDVSEPRLRTRSRRLPLQGRRLETDVLIHGAGISGMTAAVLLRRAGQRVTVLPTCQDELEPRGCLGLLSHRLGMGYASLVRDHGLEVARALAHATGRAIATVRELGREMGGCGYQRVFGYLFSEREGSLRGLREECDAARAAGLKAEVSRDIPLPFRTAGGVSFPGQAQFQPDTYLKGLRRMARQMGVEFLPKARVESLLEGRPCVVRTTTHREVQARTIFLAAQQPFLRFPFLAGLAPVRRHVICIRDEQPTAAIFWNGDVASHQMYSESRAGKRALVFAYDGSAESAEPLVGHFFRRTGKPCPPITSKCAFDVMRPVSGLPHMGWRRKNSPIFVATGFGDAFFTLGTMAALALADEVLDQPTSWTVGCRPVAPLGHSPKRAAPTALLNRSA
jgi:glycine/D-amino acid oxidase-like deaminating enzyme